MSLFAAPDFGAAGVILLGVLVAWATAMTAALTGLFWGIRLLGRASGKTRVCGGLLLGACLATPLCCWFGPAQVFCIAHGTYPLGSYPNGKIAKGMSTDEVLAILGSPHLRHDQEDQESWYYWLDSFEMGWFGVTFDRDGRVTGTGGD